MRKLKLFITNNNFLTNFHAVTVSSSHFLNFLNRHKVETSTSDTPWQRNLIGTRSTWLRHFASKQFLIHKLHTSNLNKKMVLIIVSFFIRAYISQSFSVMDVGIHGIKSYTAYCSMNHACKKRSTSEGLK